MRRWFHGRDQAWLEEKLRDLQEQEASGGRVRSTSGLETTTELLLEPTEATRKKLLWDLSVINPTEYPQCDVLPVTRTVGRFS
jgi:hypothetical protein